MEAFYGTTPYTQTLISCIIQYIYYFHRLDFQIFLPPALIMDGMEIVFLLICCPHVIFIQDPKKALLDLVLKSHRRPHPNKHDHKTLWITTLQTQTLYSSQETPCEPIPIEKNLFSLQGTPDLITGSLFSLQGFPCKLLYFPVRDCRLTSKSEDFNVCPMSS